MKYPNFDFFSENASSESTKKYFIPIAYYYTGLGALPPFSLMNVSYTNYDKNRNFELGITLNPANSAIDHWL